MVQGEVGLVSFFVHMVWVGVYKFMQVGTGVDNDGETGTDTREEEEAETDDTR
jgi:hypothetical protein